MPRAAFHINGRERAPRAEPGRRSRLLANLASQALIAEAALSPKPALADARGTGAHSDLSLEIMIRSARALRPFFAQVAQAAAHRSPTPRLRARLGRIGRRAEAAMLEATGGVNAHKGAIWSLGLLTAAASMSRRPAAQAARIAQTAAAVAAIADPHCPAAPLTHGLLVRQRFGAAGARAEARAGFPHVMRVALPLLRRRRGAGAGEENARIDTLLGLMSTLDDTCLLFRGGPAALRTAKAGARHALRAGGAATPSGRSTLLALHRTLLDLHASPGGSADLLAATLFLDALERGQTRIVL
jgi:triphosphoribosyl-dephospho-CoA synthase